MTTCAAAPVSSGLRHHRVARERDLGYGGGPPPLPRPPLIHWPIIMGAGALSFLFVVCLTVLAWRESRPGFPKSSLASSLPALVTEQLPRTVDDCMPEKKVQEPEPLEEPKPAGSLVVQSPPDAFVSASVPVAADPAAAPFNWSAPASPPTCEKFGTQVEFISNPVEAADQARKNQKLLFVLHLSGNFEDAKFT
jgi:hypothetical protein